MPGNQASEPRRWPRKREFIAYYMLYKRLGSQASLGEILDVLRELFPRRAARSVFKRLRRLGLLYPLEGGEYRVRRLEEYLDSLLEDYASKRRSRRGYSSS